MRILYIINAVNYGGAEKQLHERAAALARYLLIGGVFAWAAPGSLDYIAFLWREHTPVLNLPLDYVYACFGIFLIAVIVRSAWGAVKLLGPRWRDQI